MGHRNIQDEKDANFITIAAVEGYANKHKIPTSKVLDLFKKYNILQLIRSQYEVLHTVDLDESVSFAEDVLMRRMQ